jgi:hypothetical protein
VQEGLYYRLNTGGSVDDVTGAWRREEREKRKIKR